MEKSLEICEDNDEKFKESLINIDDLRIESVFHVKGNDDQRDQSQQETNDEYIEDLISSSVSPRRPRTFLHPWMVDLLSNEYERCNIPTRAVKQKLCQLTGLKWRVIATWFQNRRAKQKRKARKLGLHKEDDVEIETDDEDLYYEEFIEDDICEVDPSLNCNREINNSPVQDNSEVLIVKSGITHTHVQTQDETSIGLKRSHSPNPKSQSRESDEEFIPRKRGRPKKVPRGRPRKILTGDRDESEPVQLVEDEDVDILRSSDDEMEDIRETSSNPDNIICADDEASTERKEIDLNEKHDSVLDSLINAERKLSNEKLQNTVTRSEEPGDQEIPNDMLEKMIQSKSLEIFGDYKMLITQADRRAWWSQPAVTVVLGLVKSNQLSMTDAQKLMGITMSDAQFFLGGYNTSPTNSRNNNNCSNIYNRNMEDSPSRLSNSTPDQVQQRSRQAVVTDTLERLRDNQMSLKEARNLLGVGDKFIAKQYRILFGERLHIDEKEASSEALVCDDCGLVWEPVYLNHPVNLFLEDLANFEDKVLHGENISSPNLSLTMFHAKNGYTNFSSPPTLTCITPKHGKKIHWQVKHVSIGQPGASGCQMVPLTGDKSRENLLLSHHDVNYATCAAADKDQHNPKGLLKTPIQIIKKEIISEEERVSEKDNRLGEQGDKREEEDVVHNLDKPSEELVIKEEPLDRDHLVEEEENGDRSNNHREQESTASLQQELRNITTNSSNAIINNGNLDNNILSSSALYSILAHEASMAEDRNNPTNSGLFATSVPLQDWTSSISSIINYKRKSYAENILSVIPKRHCYICNESFTNLKEFRKHMTAHKARPYECNLCKKKFNHRPNLVSHLKIHSGTKDYSCPLCHRTFSHPADRLSHIVFKVCIRAARHLRKTAEGWECTTCGENKFKGSGSAERHVRIHEIGCVKKCPFCHKEFDHQQKAYTLVRHIKYEHKDNLRNLRFSCDNKQFLELFFTQDDLKSINSDNGFINVMEFEKLE